MPCKDIVSLSFQYNAHTDARCSSQACAAPQYTVGMAPEATMMSGLQCSRSVDSKAFVHHTLMCLTVYVHWQPTREHLTLLPATVP